MAAPRPHRLTVPDHAVTRLAPGRPSSSTARSTIAQSVQLRITHDFRRTMPAAQRLYPPELIRQPRRRERKLTTLNNPNFHHHGDWGYSSAVSALACRKRLYHLRNFKFSKVFNIRKEFLIGMKNFRYNAVAHPRRTSPGVSLAINNRCAYPGVCFPAFPAAPLSPQIAQAGKGWLQGRCFSDGCFCRSS